MSTTSKQRLQLSYEFEGSVREASVELTQTKASITFSALSSMHFQVAFNEPNQVILQLPSDKKGKKPTMTCDLSCIPELEAALAEMNRQAWLQPKVLETE